LQNVQLIDCENASAGLAPFDYHNRSSCSGLNDKIKWFADNSKPTTSNFCCWLLSCVRIYSMVQ